MRSSTQPPATATLRSDRTAARRAARAAAVTGAVLTLGVLGCGTAFAGTQPNPLPSLLPTALPTPGVPVPGPVQSVVGTVTTTLGVPNPIASPSGGTTPTGSRVHTPAVHHRHHGAARQHHHAGTATTTSHRHHAATRHSATALTPTVTLPANSWHLPPAVSTVQAPTLAPAAPPAVAPIPGVAPVAPTTVIRPAAAFTDGTSSSIARGLVVIVGVMLVAVAVALHLRAATGGWGRLQAA